MQKKRKRSCKVWLSRGNKCLGGAPKAKEVDKLRGKARAKEFFELEETKKKAKLAEE